MCVIGFCWLAFLHYDIQRYKKSLIDMLLPKKRKLTSVSSSSTKLTEEDEEDIEVNDNVQSHHRPHHYRQNNPHLYQQHRQHYQQKSNAGRRQSLSQRRMSLRERSSSQGSLGLLPRDSIASSSSSFSSNSCHATAAGYACIEEEASYRFLRGRHSGSFYLKCGMAGMYSCLEFSH